MRSTGPILAVGAITIVNRTIINDQPMDWRIPVGTAVAAGAFALAERANEGFTVGVAWLALLAVIFSRIDRTVPAPAESFVTWMNWTKL